MIQLVKTLIRPIGLLALSCISFTCIYAQAPEYNEEITIIAPYQPAVNQAPKINLPPQSGETNVNLPAMDYQIMALPLQSQFQPEPIKPLKLQPEKKEKLLRNYLRLGFGNYKTPYAEFNAASLRSKDYLLGVHVKHLSSAGEIKDYGKSNFSKNQIAIYGKKFFRKHTASINLNYKRDKFYYYGYRPNDLIGPHADQLDTDESNTYSLIGFNTQLKSTYSLLSRLNQDIKLDYYYLFDANKTTEHGIRAQACLDHQIELLNTGTQSIGADLDLQFYANQWDTLNDNSGLIQLTPFIRATFDEYALRVGARTAVETSGTGDFHAYPMAEARVFVIQDLLTVYAGVDGNIEQHSLQRMRSENTWINPTYQPTDTSTRFTNTKFRFYGGVQSHIGQHINLSAGISNALIEDQIFYINDTSLRLYNKFIVLSDDVKKLAITAEANYQRPGLSIALKGQYQLITPDNEAEAWHQPALKAEIKGSYQIMEQIVVSGQLYYLGEQYAKVWTGESWEAQSLKALVDLNLKGEYHHTPQLAGFISLNNLAGTRYMKYYRYPSQRFNMMLGVSYAF